MANSCRQNGCCRICSVESDVGYPAICPPIHTPRAIWNVAIHTQKLQYIYIKHKYTLHFVSYHFCFHVLFNPTWTKWSDYFSFPFNSMSMCSIYVRCLESLCRILHFVDLHSAIWRGLPKSKNKFRSFVILFYEVSF